MIAPGGCHGSNFGSAAPPAVEATDGAVPDDATDAASDAGRERLKPTPLGAAAVDPLPTRLPPSEPAAVYETAIAACDAATASAELFNALAADVAFALDGAGAAAGLNGTSAGQPM